MLYWIKTPTFISTPLRTLLRKFIHKKIVDLEILQEQHGWKVAERINKLLLLKENEFEINTLLTAELNSDLDYLIEVVLSKMRYHTIIFQTELSKHKKKLIDKLEELNHTIQFNSNEI